jgi:hypothetical protein
MISAMIGSPQFAGFTAAGMGATGTYLSSRAVFLLTAALCVPTLVSLRAIGRGQYARRQTTIQPFDWPVSRIALSDGAESAIFDGLPASASGVL